MSQPGALLILRFVLGFVVGGYSLALVTAQLRGHTHYPLLILAVAELAAAIVFLMPRGVRLGGISLIVIFVIAATFHFLHGEYNVANLAIYSSAAWAVIPKEQRRVR